MARKKDTPNFGLAGGPGFSTLRTPTGATVAAVVADWRATLDEHARAAPDDNLGWLRGVYLVPAAIGRTWQQLSSLEAVTTHNWEGRKRCRLRGVVRFDGMEWASMAPGGEGAAVDDVVLVQLLTPAYVAESIAGRMHTYPERQDQHLQRTLGRNFFSVGPVYGKTGDDEWALGYTCRCIPVEGLELGQWFRLELPAAPKWAA